MKIPILSLISVSLAATALADLDSSIASILAVGHEGEGNAEAAAAWDELSKASLADTPAILEKMNGANPLAANYLRSAVETIVARETANGAEAPLPALGQLLMDVRQDPRARQFAFDLIEGEAPETAAKLVPGLLNDPSNPLRRRAVARLMEEGRELAGGDSTGGAILIYRQALGAARDVDQVSEITKALRDLGEEVDLPRHFGFLMHWRVVAPFHNIERGGWAEEFPPENGVDLNATYKGKDEAEIKWQPFVTTDEYGKVDFNKPFGFLKEVTGYAWTEFESESDMPVELRLGCKNGWKVWLNGELLFGRDEYHRGQRIDQYVMKGQMKKGKNTILVKCCQDHQEQDWTVQWEFQLRVCDASGTAILASNRPPTPKPEKASRRPNQG